MIMHCEICPHRCALAEGERGLCRARSQRDGQIVCDNYAQLTALSLDPIEKKPLARFYPGSYVLSVGSYGCNLHCPFCQNHQIALADVEPETVLVTPEALVARALDLQAQGNIGLAFTYNEPLVGYEYVRDCARLAHLEGLKNILVSNGMICHEPWEKLLPDLDALNIDLKGFTQQFYDLVGGDLATVKENIALAARRCHLEVTTLIVPGLNDGEEEMAALAGWLAGISREIPLHISRFFPCYRLTDRPPTPIDVIYRLQEVATRHLQYVYPGNC